MNDEDIKSLLSGLKRCIFILLSKNIDYSSISTSLYFVDSGLSDQFLLTYRYIKIIYKKTVGKLYKTL